MRHAAPPIGVAEVARGILVSLPPQFWLVVSLKRTCRGVQAAAEPWTYQVPAGRGALRRVEAWAAEVALQALARARARAWTAGEAEWSGAAPAPPAPAAEPEAAIVVLPRKRTAAAVLRLLADMAGGAVLVVTVNDGARGYRLSSTGRRVSTAVAERCIRDRFVLAGGDGLFGPEWSQTWRAPTSSERDAANRRRRPRRRMGKAP